MNSRPLRLVAAANVAPPDMTQTTVPPGLRLAVDELAIKVRQLQGITSHPSTPALQLARARSLLGDAQSNIVSGIEALESEIGR